jgi:hypothetical protein
MNPEAVPVGVDDDFERSCGLRWRIHVVTGEGYGQRQPARSLREGEAVQATPRKSVGAAVL